MQLTAVYIEAEGGYVAFVQELPGANTQGDTLEEARENLREAVELGRARAQASAEARLRAVASSTSKV